MTVSMSTVLPLFDLPSLQNDDLSSSDWNELLRYASLQTTQTSDRTSILTCVGDTDLLQTIAPRSTPQQSGMKNRRVRRSRRLKIKRVGLVKRQRGFGVIKGLDSTSSHSDATHHPDKHRHHKRHHRHRKLPTDPVTGLPQPTFNQISAEMLFGAPSDIAAGWDGTLSAIDPSGAHHLYDSVNDAWTPFDEGIDAIAGYSDAGDSSGIVYCFRGSQYTTIDPSNNRMISAPTEIAETWPNLPYSFTQKVTGAAFDVLGGKLYLLNGGRYVLAGGSAPPINFTDWTTWPQTDPNFGAGVIDAVIGNAEGEALLIRNGYGLIVALSRGQVISNPVPLSETGWIGPLPTDWLESGFDTGIEFLDTNVWVFKGAAMVATGEDHGPVTPTYIPTHFSNWSSNWHPQLAQAPSGRIGNLWSIDANQNVYHHDGTAWSVISGWQATSISVGHDSTTVYLSPYLSSEGNETHVWQVDGGTSVQLPSCPGHMVQISVGNADQIWVRDINNNVYSYNPQDQDNPLSDMGVDAADAAAAADGTLWHNDNQGNVYRFLAGDSATKSVEGISNVQKLTTTGYGTAHCLVQQNNSTQLYRYDSPCVFKSAQGYPVIQGSSIVQGLGTLYTVVLTDNEDPTQSLSYIAAIDAKTGKELSQSKVLYPYPASEDGDQYDGVVFDPIHELVYVTSTISSGEQSQGVLQALDARDLTKEVWHFTTNSGIIAAPALSGTQLCINDNSATLYLFNTSRALKAASGEQNPNLQPQACGGWQQPIALPDTGYYWGTFYSAPVFATSPYGQINIIMWARKPDVHTGLFLVQCDVQTANMLVRTIKLFPDGSPELEAILFPTVLCKLALPDSNSPVPAFAFTDFNTVYAVPYIMEDAHIVSSCQSYRLPESSQIRTGLAYAPGSNNDAGAVWFGDDQGNLWSWNCSSQPAQSILVRGDDSLAYVATTPFIYNSSVADSQNPSNTVTQPIVIFGITSNNASFNWNSLFALDPDSKTVASLISTGSTEVATLSTNLSNGVIYAGGGAGSITKTDPIYAQIFGIRLDEVVQGLRDFIIESQLMQDPDETATNGKKEQNIPPSKARYQTHLTIVDDLKAPRPHEAVKIWADQPNTTIIIDGQTYTIGSDDSAFAAAKTGADGTLVIVSDASNVNTSLLRVWAAFMDPYERILVFPDHEFHDRVSNSYASSSSTSDNLYTDPDHPNLSSVGNYSGTSLFTQDEKNANQPQQVANSVQQMRQGVDPGGSTQVKLGRVLSALRSVDPNTPYVPYADLTGMHYAPNNAIATRPAQINQAIGLKFAVADPTQPYDPSSNPFSHTSMNHADARTAIDNLEGTPWSPTAAGLPFERRRVGNIFTDFWNWLVGLVDKVVAEIKQVIVSIAEDIYVGLQYIWKGITQVFKAIIKVIEDIAHAIASFFVALAKAIMDIVEALSVLFHFGEILWTQKWLVEQIQTQKDALKTIIQNHVIQNVNTFFKDADGTVQNLFKQLKSKSNPNFSTNQMPDSGATSHTTFKAGQGSVGPKSSGSSRSVHCNWSLQKTKQGLPGATTPASILPLTQSSDDPISDFINTFIDNLNNGALSSAFNQLKTDANNMFSSVSVSTFFDNLLITLLDLIEVLVLAALDVAQAFIEGILAIIDDVIDTIWAAINQELDIPVLSSLFTWISGGEKLTFLNLVTLVAAIPVTMLYRVVEGKYPSQELGEIAVTVVEPGLMPPLSAFARRLLGITGGLVAIIAGMINGFADSFGEENPPKPVPYIATALAMLIGVITCPAFTYSDPNSPPSSLDWAVYGVGLGTVFYSVFGLPIFNNDQVESELLSFILVVLSVTTLAVSIAAFIKDDSFNPDSDAAFASSVIGTIPGMTNPVKLFGEEAALVVAAIDVLAGFVVGVIGLVEALDTTS